MISLTASGSSLAAIESPGMASAADDGVACPAERGVAATVPRGSLQEYSARLSRFRASGYPGSPV